MCPPVQGPSRTGPRPRRQRTRPSVTSLPRPRPAAVSCVVVVGTSEAGVDGRARAAIGDRERTGRIRSLSCSISAMYWPRLDPASPPRSPVRTPRAGRRRPHRTPGRCERLAATDPRGSRPGLHQPGGAAAASRTARVKSHAARDEPGEPIGITDDRERLGPQVDVGRQVVRDRQQVKRMRRGCSRPASPDRARSRRAMASIGSAPSARTAAACAPSDRRRS